MRAVVQGPEPMVKAESLEKGGKDPSAALLEMTSVYVDGADHAAGVYDRTKLQAGNVITGPAIVAQMDATTLILPGHAGEVDPTGCILIRPTH